MPRHTPILSPCAVSLVGVDCGGVDSFRLGIRLDPLSLVSSLATIHLPVALVRVYRHHQRLHLFPNRPVHARQPAKISLQTLRPQRRLLVDV